MTSKDTVGSLGYAVWSDDGAAVRRLLAEGHSVDDYTGGQGVKTRLFKTPSMESLDELQTFYHHERRAITTVLLEHGADVRRRDESGHLPLHYAASAGAEAVELLITWGADVNAQSDDGSTALDVAVDRESVGAVAALPRAGADTEVRDAGASGS